MAGFETGQTYARETKHDKSGDKRTDFDAAKRLHIDYAIGNQ